MLGNGILVIVKLEQIHNPKHGFSAVSAAVRLHLRFCKHLCIQIFANQVTDFNFWDFSWRTIYSPGIVISTSDSFDCLATRTPLQSILFYDTAAVCVQTKLYQRRPSVNRSACHGQGILYVCFRGIWWYVRGS